MEEGKIQEILSSQPESPSQGEEHLRTPVTILFSDIKGSTSYFERRGDVEGLAMLERHNGLLLPCIERNSGRLVKTIGDALMTLFQDPVDAVRAAVEMQQALLEDGQTRPESERIHIRIGVHTGLGLIRDNDVFGDVVNAAARVQSKSLPDQILITDGVVPAAQTAGYQVGKMGRTKLHGKEELIDIYTMSWSSESTQRLIDDLESRFEEQIREIRQARIEAEEESSAARVQWREERRRLNAEIERLENSIRDTLEAARREITEDFRSELRFQLDASEKARLRAEADLGGAHERFETERVGYRAQIETLEKRLVEALEQVNNPARISAEIRERVGERLEKEKKQWMAQWESERLHLTHEIERLRNSGTQDPLAEARRAVQERLKAGQQGGGTGGDLIGELQSERDSLKARVLDLESEAAEVQEATRREVYRELRHRYDQRSEQAERIQAQLEQEVRALRDQHAAEKESLSTRIRHLEASVSEAQEAARVQTTAELQIDFETRIDETERALSRLERRHRDEAEEWDHERIRLMDRIEALARNLDEARDLAFKRSSEPTVEELNRLRHQLEEEFRLRSETWDDERRRLLQRIQRLESPEQDSSIPSE